MASSTRIVLAQPPFFRVFGSHNNRGPLELAYLARRLSDHGESGSILNLDRTDATTHCTWRNLFARSPLLHAALDGRSALLYESAERILGLAPDVVVLSAGDSLTPWVDLGNVFLAARLAELLRRHGIRCVGIGSRFSTAPQVRAAFDAVIDDVFGGDAVAAVLPGRPAPSFVPWAPAPPLLSADATGSTWDVVLSSFGCVRACSFCDAAAQTYRPVPPEVFAADVEQRPGRDRLDIGDAIFLARGARLAALGEGLRRAARRPEFSIELSVDQVTPGRLAELVSFGVVEVKLGIESADDSTLHVMGKRQHAQQIRAACDRVRDHGLRLTVYVLLGGPVPEPAVAALRTLKLCRTLPADDFVINVWAYNRPGAQPTDSHFSGDLVEEYRLGEIMNEFFALQAPAKPSIGRLLDIA
ncbi:B12-binding domain-containing radical SAM protein [Micromonospora sp. NBC_00858]|uniref:B12-binding domain-containing radical SAM protein n=1 Tax=Micromonospora sp. NBC_00858 TaxID=2975979 RepID=UPI00386F470D|nr:radical SAM protein [Micromonospora sp. NBC_00858]